MKHNIELTTRELECLLYIISNGTSSDDDLKALLPNKKDRDACLKGEEKLIQALARGNIKGNI